MDLSDCRDHPVEGGPVHATTRHPLSLSLQNFPLYPLPHLPRRPFTNMPHVFPNFPSPVTLAVAAMLMLSLVTCQHHQQQQPNIILFLADDVGWADVQSHDAEMRTPALQRMAEGGMVLNSSYVLPTCAPTRSALLTGR